jgi:hypothetical protein
VALRATEKALLCEIAAPAGVFTAWVPFSQLDPGSEVQAAGDSGTIVVSRWWFEISRTDKQFKAPESATRMCRFDEIKTRSGLNTTQQEVP